MWHAHLARVFTGGTPVPLFQTVPVRDSRLSEGDVIASLSPTSLDRESKSTLLLALFVSRRRDAHHTMFIAIQAVRHLLNLAALIFHAHRESLIRTTPLNTHWQIAF